MLTFKHTSVTLSIILFHVFYVLLNVPLCARNYDIHTVHHKLLDTLSHYVGTRGGKKADQNYFL